MPREDVAEARHQAASDENGHPRRVRRFVETEERGDAVALVGDRGHGCAGVDRAGGDGAPNRAGTASAVAATPSGNGRSSGRRPRPVRRRQPARRLGLAIGDEQSIDAGRVDQLAGGTCAGRAGTDEQDRAHLSGKSGPSSSRHPPDVGGAPPVAADPQDDAHEHREHPDQQAPTKGRHASEVYGDGVATRREPTTAATNQALGDVGLPTVDWCVRGARWTRTTDLILIRDAL